MLDPKGLEAAARKLRNAEKEKFGSWPDADDSRSIAAAAITAYLSSVQAEPVAYVSEDALRRLAAGESIILYPQDRERIGVPLYASALVATPPAERVVEAAWRSLVSDDPTNITITKEELATAIRAALAVKDGRP